MSWRSGTYGLQGSFGDERPPLWPRLAAVVVVLAIVLFGVRACRSLDRETVEQRRTLAQEASAAHEVGLPPQERALPPRPPPILNDDLPAKVRAQILSADALVVRSDLAAAFEAYQSVLTLDSNALVRTEIEDRIGALAIPLTVSRLPMRGKIPYVIQRGDAVSLIARRFGVTQEYLLRANGLSDPNKIVVGRELRVLDHPVFEIVVSKRARTLTVTLDGRFFKRYPVSVGRADETPVGTFVIRSRIVNPAWWRTDGSAVPYGDAENILGTRWLGLAAADGTPAVRGVGIHGTWEDRSIGREASAGCVRMRNSDVEELHLLVPLETPVSIR